MEYESRPMNESAFIGKMSDMYSTLSLFESEFTREEISSVLGINKIQITAFRQGFAKETDYMDRNVVRRGLPGLDVYSRIMRDPTELILLAIANRGSPATVRQIKEEIMKGFGIRYGGNRIGIAVKSMNGGSGLLLDMGTDGKGRLYDLNMENVLVSEFVSEVV